MSNESRLKVPVPRRMYLWSLNESSGEVITHIGPTEFTPSANDRVVRSNGLGGFEAPAKTQAVPFIVARAGEYVVLRNPVNETDESQPNGTHVAGANKEKELRLGSTKIVPGPCGFPLWPGQSVEVRKAHKLDANQYLVVEVTGELDERAMYADLVRKAAGLNSVVLDPDEDVEITADPSAAQVARAEDDDRVRSLVPGQRVVIHGRHTQLFIPPTGVEVVPAIDENERSHASNEANAASLTVLPTELKAETSRLLELVSQGITRREFGVLKNELRHRHDVSTGDRAIVLTALEDAFREQSEAHRAKRGRSERAVSDIYTRRAVVLGPKAFCYLFDADGNARIVRGPARVFPGPYDTFLRRGSRGRSYDAFELGEHQALFLRLIKPIDRETLVHYLPAGFPLEQATYDPGHEFVIQGNPSVFFPFIEAEVINPITRDLHVGNHHDDVIIDAIGINQSSGIYVRDLHTGRVRTVRGERSYLVDPRHEEHVLRKVAAKEWNLIVARNEPAKQTATPVVTPWALGVTIPADEAVLVEGPNGRRVELGPSRILLDYEETLARMQLSSGAAKTGRSRVETCFLRVNDAQVADTFELRSKDGVPMRVSLGYTGGFELDDGIGDLRWFAIEDPVKLLADRVRALLRESVMTHDAFALLESMSTLVRELLLPDGERMSFEENRMFVSRVDVLSIHIADPGLSRAYNEARLAAVKARIELESAEVRLTATRRQDEIDAAESKILDELARRRATHGIAEAESTHRLALRELELDLERKALNQVREHERESAKRAFEREQVELAVATRALELIAEGEAQARAEGERLAVQQRHEAAMAEVRKDLAQAMAAADAAKLQAVQPELVAALFAAADAQVMTAAAENMNLVSLLGGRSPAEILGQLVEGTPLARTARRMRERSNDE